MEIRRKNSYLRTFFVLCTGTFILLLMTSYQYDQKEMPEQLKAIYTKIAKNSNGAEECKFEPLNPWDPSVLPYIEEPRDRLKCKLYQQDLVFLNTTTEMLMLNQSISTGFTNLVCTYSALEHDEGITDEAPKFSAPIKFGENHEILMKDQFALVDCKAGPIVALSVFRREFFNAKRLPKHRQSGRKPMKSSPQQPSVFIFGMDSTSNSNFKRQLSKTYNYLNSSEGFVEFQSYVKVWDNTYTNVMALLSGQYTGYSDEFPDHLPWDQGIFYDNFTSYIWDEFSKKGYTTMFIEDRPDIHLFNYLGENLGFKNQPVDFYGRPFWLSIYGNWLHRRSTAYCYNDKPEHVIQLDAVRNFIIANAGQRHFGLSWLQGITHEYLNLPSVADEDFVEFFTSIESSLENTIVLVMSDHGHRMDKIRQTVAGRMESRLPFMSFLIPKSIRDACPKSVSRLLANSKKMTTAHDLHETLLHIADGRFCAEDVIDAEGTSEETPRRNYDLFTETIPRQRTCHQAYIPEDLCPCVSEVSLDVDDEMAQNAVTAFINVANRLLLDGAVDLCAPLQLESIQRVSVEAPNQFTIRDRHTQNRMPDEGSYKVKYRTVITAMPNNAQLEALLQYDFYANEYRLIGEIDRNNKYGNTSHCISDRHLRKFCYCKDLL